MRKWAKVIWRLTSTEVKISLVLMALLVFQWQWSNRKISTLERQVDTLLQKHIDRRTITRDAITEHRPTGQVTKYRPPEGYVIINEREWKEAMERKARLEARLARARMWYDTENDTIIGTIEGLEESLAVLEIPPLVTVQRHGWCLKPFLGYGVVVGQAAGATWEPLLGVKLAFWDRWNCGVGACPSLLGLTLGYHPRASIFSNLEITGTVGAHIKGKLGLATGIKLDL